MRGCGTLWDTVPSVIVKMLQPLRLCKNAIWTVAQAGLIIGLTKEVVHYDGPLKTGLTLTLLCIAVGMDLSSCRIKNQLIIFGMAAGILSWLPFSSKEDVGSLLAGIVIPIVVCWIPFLMHALGAGDIKLFSVVGCINGGWDAVFCIGFSFFIAAVMSLCRLIREKQLWTSLGECYQYFQQIFMEQKIRPYSGRKKPGHVIHFSMAIIFGYLVWMGVKICRIMPLY